MDLAVLRCPALAKLVEKAVIPELAAARKSAERALAEHGAAKALGRAASMLEQDARYIEALEEAIKVLLHLFNDKNPTERHRQSALQRLYEATEGRPEHLDRRKG